MYVGNHHFDGYFDYFFISLQIFLFNSFFLSYQDTTRTILEAYSGTSLGETEVNIMSGAGELSGAGCAGCKTAYQIQGRH